jgi:AraC-like DNA-binding protein
MRYSQQELFVGAVEDAPNCSPDSDAQNIFPKLMLMVFLEGRQDFEIDGKCFKFDAGSGDECNPVVHMLNVARSATLQFHNVSNSPLHKVMISAPRSWLDALVETRDGMSSQRLKLFLDEHLAHFSFTPGAGILASTRKIMRPPSMLDGDTENLFLKAQGLEIMWQSCLTLTSADAAERSASAIVDFRRSEGVRDYILENLHRNLTLRQISEQARTSASTIQRSFKKHFGMTISEFTQFNRLEVARKALTTQGVRVSQAAQLAGYGNASSFTTAFRKQYGVSPKQVRS